MPDSKLIGKGNTNTLAFSIPTSEKELLQFLPDFNNRYNLLHDLILNIIKTQKEAIIEAIKSIDATKNPEILKRHLEMLEEVIKMEYIEKRRF